MNIDRLPREFLQSMQEMLCNEYEDFLASYTKEKKSGIRANIIKMEPDELKELFPQAGPAIPWTKDGLYFDGTKLSPALHPLYYAGLYYIQEPSAMLPANLLAPQSGEKILDLCAAPGGKSIQLAGAMNDCSLLIVNDPQHQRAKVLLKNIERFGLTHTVVLSEQPENIADRFYQFFDGILVDAPCSGEGMFKKDPDIINKWSPDIWKEYSKLQQNILESAASMLQPGGRIVYSTCTFNKEENEHTIRYFTERHPEFTLTDIKRIWPHLEEGEGHFAAVMIKKHHNSEKDTLNVYNHLIKKASIISENSLKLFEDFLFMIWEKQEMMSEILPAEGSLIERSGHIIWEIDDIPALTGISHLRSGWLLGTVEKNRFRPSHAFALGLKHHLVDKAIRKCRLHSAIPSEMNAAVRYLKGETLISDDADWKTGWLLVELDGFALGWGKGNGNSMKNELPPGWRII